MAQAREEILKLPIAERPALYRLLAASIAYRSQRDNEAKYASALADWPGALPGDAMCNMTSVAMAVNGLGLGMNETTKQLEDYIDEKTFEDLGNDPEQRLLQSGQQYGANLLGEIEFSREDSPGFGSPDEARTHFQTKILPRLEEGATATMSILWQYGPHIVRLQWVEAGGLTVDDPYGNLNWNKTKGVYNYDSSVNTPGSEDEREQERGMDNFWSWEMVADINAGRYVQFLNL